MSFPTQLPMFAGAPKPRLHDDTLPRHCGNANSVEANKAVAPKKEHQKKKLYDLIAASANGLCIHELEKLTGWAQNEFSGRLTWMKDAKKEKVFKIEVCGNCKDAGRGHGTKAAIYRVRT